MIKQITIENTSPEKLEVSLFVAYKLPALQLWFDLTLSAGGPA